MANGLTCIANDIPANREVLDNGKAGLLVPVGQVEALCSAMRLAVKDAELARAYGTAACIRVKECYSIDSVVGRYLNIYSKLQQKKLGELPG
jgi:glycosyltransferase involved in cell wall biosynthesis